MSRTSVEVSRATPVDLDELMDVWSLARDEFAGLHRALVAPGSETVRCRLAAALEAGEVDVLLARREGRLVGYALLRTGQFLPLMDSQAVTIEQIFVEAGVRKQGIATALLTAVAAQAERCGAEQIVTTSPPGSREAQRFLARLGFSPMFVRRTTSTAALRRRLAGEGRATAIEALLSRRRTLRARMLGTVGDTCTGADVDEPEPAAPTLAPTLDPWSPREA